MIRNKNAIYRKLQKGKRLDAAEIKTIERAFKECEKTHGIGKEYVSVYECSVCKHWEFKDSTLRIEFYKFYPRCGAKMDGEK